LEPKQVYVLSMVDHSKRKSNGLLFSLYTISFIVPWVLLKIPQSGSKFFPVSWTLDSWQQFSIGSMSHSFLMHFAFPLYVTFLDVV
jgi:hypothetical protein